MMRVLLVLFVLFAMPGPAVAEPAAHGSEPLLFVISLNEQKLQAFRGLEMIAETRISSGKSGFSTPTGIFSVLHKSKYHRSNIYSGAPMPWMQRLTWTGIALHQGVVPEQPASHGCVRIPEGLAENLFSISAPGVHVVINGPVLAPRAIAHPLLPQPVRGNPPLSLVRSMGYPVAEAASLWTQPRQEKPLRILISRISRGDQTLAVQKGLRQLGHYNDLLDGLVGKATTDAVRSFQQLHGLEANGAITTTTVSALFKTLGWRQPPNGRLYLRQGFEPLFDEPISIDQPELPLGTHLFTLHGYDKEAGKTGWKVLTLDNALGKLTRALHGIDAEASDKVRAEDALSRVTLSPELAARLAELLTAGSSIVTSDNGWEPYTGWNTDFVVTTRSAQKAELVASIDGNDKPVKRRLNVVRGPGKNLAVVERRVHVREIRTFWLKPANPAKGLAQRKVANVRPVLKRVHNPRLQVFE